METIDTRLSNLTRANWEKKDLTKKWKSITDNIGAKIILESYTHEHKRLILDSVADKSLTISEIVTNCKIPYTTCYRRIISLVQARLLVEDSDNIMHAGIKGIKRYKRAFEDFEIIINKKGIFVDIVVNQQ